jgi:ATP-dependent helicase/nuclease subunit A
MECLDYNKIESLDDVKADIKKMLDSEKMNSMQAGCIRADDVYEFVKSPIGQRIKEAVKKNNVRREQPFMFEYDRQLVQGVIDLYMIEDDKIVLVDYKTDRVKKGKAGEQELIRRYSVQLDYYALALVQLTGLEVKEKIIYSFALGKQISLE